MRTLKTPDALNTQMESLERKAANRIVKARRETRKDKNVEAMRARIFGNQASA